MKCALMMPSKFKVLGLTMLASGLLLTTPATTAAAQAPRPLTSQDLHRFRAVSQVALSPYGHKVAYVVMNYDRPGRPYPQLFIMDLASGQSTRLGGATETSSSPLWSPDGNWIAWSGHAGGQSGLVVSHSDGTDAHVVAKLQGTDAPLPKAGDTVAWSPDSSRLAYVSATPGPESNGDDPRVVTRYLYRPTAAEGINPFNDNRRLHIFVVNRDGSGERQLTQGNYYEHGISWSPNGKEILYLSNPSPYADQFFQYDVFALNPDSGASRRLTATEYTEYSPAWSPDGSHIAFLSTKRGLTDRETTMEDTHVWIMDPDGGHRAEWAKLDDRQGDPVWARDGQSVYFTVQERGNVPLYRLALGNTQPQEVVGGVGRVGSFSTGPNGALAYSFTGADDMGELFYVSGPGAAPRQLTHLNADVLAGRALGKVVSFTFISNDNKYTVEGFLTIPPQGTPTTGPGDRHPLIVSIHGGPHGQNGASFTFKDQVYAGLGWAVLHVNYRGSTGYGQAFADAVFGDQDGNEGQDVLYGVSAALRRYLWLDPTRMGIEGTSYGGQLTDWLITQTREFKAAIPTAGITNLISYNYLTYYNQYEQMEFGALPSQNRLMDELWDRSALHYVAQVATPVMFLHGANDNDVPIPDAEQYYIALKDVGVEDELVIYPREGHGLREVGHQVDGLNRSIAWYRAHFKDPNPVVPIP